VIAQGNETTTRSDNEGSRGLSLAQPDGSPTSRERTPGLSDAVGEHTDDSVRRLISLFTRSNGFVEQIFFQCLTGKSANAVTPIVASRSMLSTLENWRSSMPTMTSSWERGVFSVGLGEYIADRVGDPLPMSLGTWQARYAGNARGSVATRRKQHRLDRRLEPGVSVADDQLDAVQPSGLHATQERGPERAVLTVDGIKAEHLTAAAAATPVATTTTWNTTG
jgi:hypothetical protein